MSWKIFKGNYFWNRNSRTGKIFENAESIHRLMAEQEKMDSAILAFEVLVLCIKEKMSTVSMKWIVDTSGYPDVETRIGKIILIR